jgi:hypothetical protein
MNEPLCRALVRARLTEDDVAARLEVDPKTVRRWLEGRVPYLRHRWALAAMTGEDETDLWPQLRADRTRPKEVVAIYPSRDAVPSGVWLRLYCSARHDIGILARDGYFVAEMPGVLTVLAERARAGVRVRICLADPVAPFLRNDTGQPVGEPPARREGQPEQYASLTADGAAELRRYQVEQYAMICYADSQFLVSQHVYGIPAGQVPVLHLQRTSPSDMTTAYMDSFERAWTDAVT